MNMDIENFMSFAKAHGYLIRFTGMGMAYIEFSGLKLTETVDKERAYQILAQIGMAIMLDVLRTDSDD